MKPRKPLKRRNLYAVGAHFQSSAGPMKHRTQPRGGTRNKHQDILDEAQDEWGDPEEEMTEAIDNLRTAHDLATMTRLLPWILMGDKRPPELLAKCALNDVVSFIEQKNRPMLLRGLVYSLCNVLGAQIAPEHVEQLVKTVISQVDELIAEEYDDGLEGKKA